ncbi:MAG: insulinase family protein [Anaerolineae bacterium]|nr:insulinase family protein [Gloeobacterales cyanobacterium ES-bin-313]
MKFLRGLTTLSLVFSMLSPGIPAAFAETQSVPKEITFVSEAGSIREYRLTNGLKILLVENRVAPVATFLVAYKVGSRNEAIGYTGSTHLLEHMMFKGTPTFNKAKNTQIAATLQRIGASFNATTNRDRTSYFETVPSNQLELAIKLEADRMRHSLIADEDRRSEMTVVRNELEQGENSPRRILGQYVEAAAFREHPYHHPTIGWRSDVENVPTARLKDFYNTFYHPANATAIVVGDFDSTNVLQLIAKYFGRYPKPSVPIPQVYTSEPIQQGERRVILRRTGDLPIVELAFHTPAAFGQTTVLSDAELAKRATDPSVANDTYALDLLASSLSVGVTSRLYQTLVETQLATSVGADSDTPRDPGLFKVIATLRPTTDPAKVEATILAELDKVIAEGLTSTELDKAKQQFSAQLAFGRDGTASIAAQLAEAESVGDWHYYQNYETNIAKVTNAEIQRVAKKYFTEDNRTVGYFVPKAKSIGIPKLPTTSSTVNPVADNPILAASPLAPSSPKATTIAERVQRTQLANGATLVVLENHATPSVAIRGTLLAGAYFEPTDKRGLAGITAAMLERGTLKRSKLQIAQSLESVGASVSFSGDTFSVNIGGRSLAKDLPMVLSTLAEELREPAFPAEELEKIKSTSIVAIRERRLNTGFRSYQRFVNLDYPKDSPFYVPENDTLIASVQAITVADVRKYYQEHFGGRSLILTVVGDVSGSDVAKQFTEGFQDFQGPKDLQITVIDPPLPTTTKRESVVVTDKASVDIIMGIPASLRRNSPDYFPALFANSALGQSTISSRLGLQVRDKEGLTYGIGSSFSSPSLAGGPWSITLSANPNNVEQSIRSAKGVLEEYVQKGMRPDELADEKSSAIGRFQVGLSTNAGLAASLLNSEFYKLGPNFLDQVPQILSAVTLEEVNTAIRKYFHPDLLTVVTAGDYTPAKSP